VRAVDVAAGAPATLTLADLDAETSARLSDNLVDQLGKAVEERARAQWTRLASKQPFLHMPADFRFDEVELSTRARNAIGRFPNAWLREATIDDLMQTPQLGASVLVELLRAYEESVGELADRADIDVSPIGVLSANGRVRAKRPSSSEERVATRRAVPQRVKEMYSGYEAGATLEEIAKQSDLTRERVRQLFREAGLTVRSIGETAALKRKSLADSNRDRIINAFESGKTARTIAGELALPLKLVREVLVEDPRRARLMSARSHAKKRNGPRYSNEELIDCLRTASLAIGGILTTAAYNVFARTRVFPDGRPWPTHQTPSNRFGGWRAALQQAGLESNPPSAIAGQRIFTRGHCIDAILEVERALGHLPTAADYEEYATKMGGAIPSLATVRNRCGSWRDALRLAVEFS
jgi:hypothetical protein